MKANLHLVQDELGGPERMEDSPDALAVCHATITHT